MIETMNLWPFRKRISLQDSGIFSGFTDWHSHILPGVDDGVRTMGESLEILRLYEKLGVRSVWLTPHIMEDIPNTTAHLRKRFAELQASYSGSVELHLAAENMLDGLFEERLEKNDLLPLGETATICWWKPVVSVRRWTCTAYWSGSRPKATIRFSHTPNGMAIWRKKSTKC